MPEQKPRSPRLWHVIVGVLAPSFLLCLLMVLLISLKMIGYYFLLIPARLGLVQLAAPSEIWRVDLRTATQVRIVLERPGLYAAYSLDTEILTRADRACQDGFAPWFHVQLETTGETIPLSCVARGMALYDTPFAAGRPFYTFEVRTPGKYLVQYSHAQGVLYIVPDYTTGHEAAIVAIYVVEFLILLIPPGLVIYLQLRYRQARVRRITDPQKQRHARGDAFWQAEMQKRQGKKGPEE